MNFPPGTHAFFSATHARTGCSINVARTTDGREVTYTCAGIPGSYHWADADDLGEIVEYVRLLPTRSRVDEESTGAMWIGCEDES